MKIDDYIRIIDEEIERLGIEYLTPPEANKLLESNGLLDDYDNRSGKPFREILRKNLIPHAYKINGRWRIPSSKKIKDLNINFKDKSVIRQETSTIKTMNIIKKIKSNLFYLLFIIIGSISLIVVIKTIYFSNKNYEPNTNIIKLEQEESASEIIYDTLRNGYIKNYFRLSNKIESEGQKLNNNKEGIWKFYSSDGILLEKTFFKNDKKNGICEIYSSSGYLIEKYLYQNDKKNGEGILYFENGKIKEKYTYKNDMKNGEYIGYHYIEKLNRYFISDKGFYRNDMKNGEWKSFEYYYDIANNTFGNKLILTDIINLGLTHKFIKYFE